MYSGAAYVLVLKVDSWILRIASAQFVIILIVYELPVPAETVMLILGQGFGYCVYDFISVGKSSITVFGSVCGNCSKALI